MEEILRLSGSICIEFCISKGLYVYGVEFMEFGSNEIGGKVCEVNLYVRFYY